MKHLLVTLLLALPAVAFAGPKEEAQKHVSKATEAHQAGKYDVALNELQAAYKLDPQPDLLYAIGQVYVKLDKCDEAVTSYEKFLATKPAKDAGNSAQEAIDTCKAQKAAAAAPPPEATPPPTPAPEPQPAPPPTPPPAEGSSFDKVGVALVGAGVVSMVVGVVIYSSAVSTLDDAEMAATYNEHADLVDSAHTKRNIGVAFGGIGIALTGVGVWHYMKHKSERTVAVTPTTGGGMVTWMGRF